MRKVILDLAISLDGFIEGPKGQIDWCIMDEDMEFDGFLSGIDTIFYGRVSYKAWGNYQPTTDAPEAEKALWKEVHSKKKFVFSHEQKEDDHATYIHKIIPERVREIKAQEGKDIWLYGGAGLIQTFIEFSLIDQYQLSVHPVALGSGKPLFEDLKGRLELDLVARSLDPEWFSWSTALNRQRFCQWKARSPD
jgi:dihydrofolate reductase